MTTSSASTGKKLTRLDPKTWRYVLKATMNRFTVNGTTDLAAGLTYFTVLSLFPGILGLISIAQLAGIDKMVMPSIINTVQDTIPDPKTADTVLGVIRSFMQSRSAGLALVIGTLTALWTASGYVGAFSRACNKVYNVEEGRNPIRLKLTQFATTVVMVVAMVIVLIILAASGGVARWVGGLIGLGPVAVTVWSILRWPLLFFVMVAMIGLLNYVGPNVARTRFRWISAGSLTAVGVAILAVAGFGFYASNFANYNKTYGALAGVIIGLFLVWLCNVALLFGATLSAEIQRARQLSSGVAAEREGKFKLRQTDGLHKLQEKQDRLAMQASQIRTRRAKK